MQEIIQPQFKFNMGTLCKDVLTGYTGVIAARIEFITGCNNYRLQPTELDDKGNPKEGQMFDENRLEVIGEGVRLPDSNTPAPEAPKAVKHVRPTKGGPQPRIPSSPNRL